jgi:hypothetical protein
MRLTRCSTRMGFHGMSSCKIGDRLFALEHTGIEPFAGHMQMEVEADRLFRPIKENSDGH